MPRITHVSIVLNHNNIAVNNDSRDPLRNVRCIHCGQLLGKASGRLLMWSNTRSPEMDQIPLGVDAFETKCKQCNATYMLLWQ